MRPNLTIRDLLERPLRSLQTTSVRKRRGRDTKHALISWHSVASARLRPARLRSGLRRWLWWSFALGVTAVAIAPAAASTSASPPRRLPPTIVLDHSMGGVAILDRKSVVEKRIGRGRVYDAGNRVFIVTYPRYGIQIAYVPRGPFEIVSQVETESPRYRTSQGVHIGSPVAAVKALPGRVSCVPDIDYTDGRPSCVHYRIGQKGPGEGPSSAFHFDARRRVRWMAVGNTSL